MGRRDLEGERRGNERKKWRKEGKERRKIK